MMDRAKFYAHLRRRDSGVFGSSLTQKQVEGMEAILDECQRFGCDLGQTAYILATAYGETGRRMQPVREDMNYSAKRIPEVFSPSRRQGVPVSKLAGNPKLLANTVYGGEWGKKNLGNVLPDDGWNFRGALIGQITGRYNIANFGNKLGLDLVGNPALLDRLDVGVRSLVQPMMEGWATGRRLSQYVAGVKRDYVGARAVWNSNFEANKYAEWAQAFEAALAAGGFTTTTRTPTPPPTIPQSAEKTDWARIIKWFLSLFGGKK